MNDTFETDIKPVLNMFKELSYKEQIKTYKSALRKSSNVIAKEAKKNLKSSLGKSASHNGKYGRMNKGIKVRVAKSGKSSKIHIMGDFRLKWFEMGTKERIRKKGGSTGKISPLYFFKKANDSKKKEAENLLIKNLEEAIIKINNKHK